MEALIFDMDGVIVDSEPYNMMRVLEYARSIRPEITREQMYQVVGRTKEDVWTRIAGVIGQGKGWEETRQDYEANWKPWHPYPVRYKDIFRPEVIRILKQAKAEGVRTAVASATAYDKVKEILTEVGVTPYLDLIVSGESCKRSKPDPDIYLKTAKLLGVEPKDCVAVEDSTVGITAAHRAGIKVIALKDDRFDFDRNLADAEIDDLGEFEACFQQLCFPKMIGNS